jgi:hypothetical protein
VSISLRRAAACVVVAAGFIAVAPAQAAFVYTDIINFNLTESTSTYGGGTQFHISSGGDGSVS